MEYPMQPEERIEYFKDGSVRARGWMLEGMLSGYWEWFRKNGIRMRSGHFERGVQVGEWTTYDQNGAVYKKTTMKPKGT
ncbi:hypothetical protein PGB34_18895 [Xenophilus arseniciresistens]|uniref:MORN repeat variant n=1 Tax=Xenophilus arseniciresistens TaxID=1283306 RepID=A0AAE3T0P8_9BURK|nr:hypothetical protein [Xenophilus arseniciresistens]MDA7418442.1 hypothetical protein [Xenophilus arseniciresistens]